MLLALRHPPPLVRGLCAGRFDLPVEDPREHIAAIVARLRPRSLRRVTSSPSPRCRDTAERLAAALRLPLSLDERLRELDFGAWEGRAWSEIEREDGARLRSWCEDWQSTGPPGGETVSLLVARIRVALLTTSEPRLLITHAGPIRVLRVLRMGWGWERAMSEPVAYLTPIEVPDAAELPPGGASRAR